MSKIIFVSAVTAEFHKTDPERPQLFHSYRDTLAAGFRRLGPDYIVVVQEDFAQGPGDLLQTLDVEVAKSSLVIHLVGKLAGENPAPASVRKLRDRHPDFLMREPELAASLAKPPEPSFTQWELYLAYEHRKRRFVYLADTSAPRSPFFLNPPDGDAQALSQEAHCARWKATGEHYESFADQKDLTFKAVTSAVRFGMGPAGGAGASTEGALELAREQVQELVQEMRRLIKAPDRHAVPVPDPAGVADFLHAIDTVALRRELDRRGTLQVIADFRHQKESDATTEPTPENLLEWAFAEVACGHYRDAMRIAQQAADEAMKQIRDRPDDEARREVGLNAFLLLHEAAKAAKDSNSAIAAQENAGKLVDKHKEPVKWADLHETLATYLLYLGQHRRAAEYIDEIVDIREEHQGENVAALPTTLLLWVEVLSQEGKFQGLDNVAARAARLFASLKPPNLLGFAAAISAQALLLYSAGNYPKAEPLFKQALEIMQNQLGPEHFQVAACLNNLALLLKETNRLAEAEPLMRRALAIDEQSFGDEHPKVATRLNNLAALLQETNRLEGAEPLLRRALAIDEQSFGHEHPKVATVLNNLAQLLQATNRLAEAEPLMRRALAIDEQSFGNEHPKVAGCLHNLAALLQATNRLAEAEPLIRRALAIDEQSFGNEHPKVALRLINLAQLLQATNRPAEAEPLMRRALAINKQIFGNEHPNVAVGLNNLAQLLQGTSRLAEAEPLLRRALAIDEQSFGHEHPKVVIRLNNLAALLHETNRLAEAEPLMRRALAIMQQSLGPDSPSTKTIQARLNILRSTKPSV